MPPDSSTASKETKRVAAFLSSVGESFFLDWHVGKSECWCCWRWCQWKCIDRSDRGYTASVRSCGVYDEKFNFSFSFHFSFQLCICVSHCGRKMRIKAFRVECYCRESLNVCWWMALVCVCAYRDADVNGRQWPMIEFTVATVLSSPVSPNGQCYFDLLFLVPGTVLMVTHYLYSLPTTTVLLFIHFWPPPLAAAACVEQVQWTVCSSFSAAFQCLCLCQTNRRGNKTLPLLIRRLSISRERLTRVSVMHHLFIHSFVSIFHFFG